MIGRSLQILVTKIHEKFDLMKCHFCYKIEFFLACRCWRLCWNILRCLLGFWIDIEHFLDKTYIDKWIWQNRLVRLVSCACWLLFILPRKIYKNFYKFFLLTVVDKSITSVVIYKFYRLNHKGIVMYFYINVFFVILSYKLGQRK